MIALTFDALGIVPHKLKGYPIEFLLSYRKGGPQYGSTVADSLEKGTKHEDEYMISEKELLVNRWEKDVVGMVEQEHGKSKILISFVCETLKADKAAEDHVRQFMPKLAGMDAVDSRFDMDVFGNLEGRW